MSSMQKQTVDPGQSVKLHNLIMALSRKTHLTVSNSSVSGH